MGTRIIVSILTFTCTEQCTVSNVRAYTLVLDTMMATGKYCRFERITIYCTAILCNYSVISLPALPLKQPVYSN